MSRVICTSPFGRVPDVLPPDAVVVTPHKPAAAALGRPLVSLRQLAGQTLRRNGLAPAEPRIAAQLLRQAIAEAKPGVSASAMSRRIGTVLKTVLRVGIDHDELEQHGSAGSAELARIARLFRQKLRRLGLVHSDETLWEAAQAEVIEPRLLHIYGYTRARREEIEFIDRISADGSVYYLPLSAGVDIFAENGELAERLIERGWIYDTADIRPQTAGEMAAAKFAGLTGAVPDAVAALRFADTAAEVRYVLGDIKRMLRAGTLPGEIAIVARDLDRYAKELSVVGREYGIPSRSTLKIPLAETLVGGFVRLLLDVVSEAFDFEGSARLLRHPLGPGLDEEAWAAARKRRLSSLEKWAELSGDISCLDDMASGASRPAADWVRCLRSVFNRFGVRSKAGHSARETHALNCLQDELSHLALEPGDISFAQFAVQLGDILSDVTTEFDPSKLGVLLTEPNRIVGGSFKHVFVLGMAEGMLPALPSDNPVIDFYERRELAKKKIFFEVAPDITKWESLAFFSVLSTAREALTLSYPAAADNDEKIASSFFDRLGLTPEAAAVKYLSSGVEMHRNRLRRASLGESTVIDGAMHRLVVECRRESADAHDEYDGVIGEAIDVSGRIWSVSQLKMLAGCGFQWFAKYALDLKPQDELELEESAAERGKLIHLVLQYVVQRSAAQTAEEMVSLLDEAIEQARADPEVQVDHLANIELRLAEIRSQIESAISSPEFLPAGAEVVDVEKEFEFDFSEHIIRGRIDRIDRTPSGLLAIDYKSGKNAPKRIEDREGRKVDLQMAVYKAALERIYPAENVTDGAYFLIASRKLAAAKESDDLAAFIDAAVNGPRTGSLPVAPLNVEVCRYCDYETLCRRGARFERKGGE